jgi:hypothetical protein
MDAGPSLLCLAMLRTKGAQAPAVDAQCHFAERLPYFHVLVGRGGLEYQ